MSETSITVYGAPWCPDCTESKKFLTEQRVPFDWVDIDQDEAGKRYVSEVNNGKQIIPTIVFGDGSILVEPTNADLATKLGINLTASQESYDLIIIGAGPSGLTAAIYAARENISTLVIEQGGIGGQAATTEIIENYPGFPNGIGGPVLADQIKEQAERFGVEILKAQAVTNISVDGDHKYVRTESGDRYRAKAVLLATGTRYRHLNVEGEEGLIGAGIHFCATCDGPFYKGKELVVVGGGNSGIEEGLFLTKFAEKVTVLEVRDKLGASRILQDKAAANPKMEIRTSTTVEAFRGNGKLSSVLIKDLKSGTTEELHPGGVFVFIGLDPNSGAVKDLIDIDDWGFISTNDSFQTSVPGIFAAGDVRSGSTKQVSSAVGDGTTAALGIRRYLDSLDEE